MQKIVPLISTRSTGPLGIIHLPRLWQKMRLDAAGKLDEGYRSGKGGLDGVLLETLGLEYERTTAFIAETQPSYLEFENWVRENALPERITPEAIKAFNDKFLTLPKPEPERTEMLKRVGLPVDDSLWLASDLNDQDDWHGFHEALLEDD